MGMRPEQMFIKKIVDRDGNVLEENRPFSRSVISPQTAYIMTTLLQNVIEHGTGMRARALGRPAAGKTGTTNSLNDAWFMGYIPGLAAGSWMGYDDEKPLGHKETGSRAALPIWLKFMQLVTEDTPVQNFPVPDGIEFARIDPKTGLIATASTEEPIFEVFKTGTAPVARAAGATKTRSDDFFLIDSGSQGNNDIMRIDEGTGTGIGESVPAPATDLPVGTGEEVRTVQPIRPAPLEPPAPIDRVLPLSSSAEAPPAKPRALRLYDLNN